VLELGIFHSTINMSERSIHDQSQIPLTGDYLAIPDPNAPRSEADQAIPDPNAPRSVAGNARWKKSPQKFERRTLVDPDLQESVYRQPFRPNFEDDPTAKA